LYSGIISGNQAVYGGGVAVGSGIFNMSDAAITANTATTNGGGVYNQGIFNMNGGIVSDNRAIGGNGGGVYAPGGIAFNMTQNSVVSGNTATTNGGGVYLNAGAFNITQGILSDNTATGGGGIYATDYALLNIGPATVFSGNAASVARDPGDVWASYTNIRWAGENSLGGTYSPQNAPHLLNNYDVNYTTGIVLYIVTFNGNGGTPDSQIRTTASGTSLGVNMPSDPTLSGYTFAGWNTQADGLGTAFTSSTVVNAHTTVYAIYQAVVTFNGNGGTPNTQTRTID